VSDRKTDPQSRPGSPSDPNGRAARLDALLSFIPDFVFFKHRDRRYLDVSAAFEGMLGRPPSEIVGRRDEELFPADVAAIGKADDERVLQTGEPVIDRVESDGAGTWVSTTKVPWRDAEGRTVGLVAISRDITASKSRLDRLQREAAQASRMEALGRLAGGVAHDFNNLLMVIMSAVEELGSLLPRDHEGLHEVEFIRDASNRADALVRQLLTFSRRQPAAPRPVDVAALVDGLRPIVELSYKRLS